MELSEEELRMLEQMERALVEEDPKLASTLRGTSFQRAARRRMILGGAILLVGIGLLIVAVLLDLTAVLQTITGVLGFVVMLAGAILALTSARSPGRSGAAAPPRAACRRRPRSASTPHDRARARGSARCRPALPASPR